MHRATDQFWERYDRLSENVRVLADRSFQLLKENPRHPSLQFKKVEGFWSARVDLTHRALAVKDGADFIWVWIGNHDEYKSIIRRGRH